ncbi:MAG: hypothetical protein R2751_17370 [Bacteroidales bacterium]
MSWPLEIPCTCSCGSAPAPAREQQTPDLCLHPRAKSSSTRPSDRPGPSLTVKLESDALGPGINRLVLLDENLDP